MSDEESTGPDLVPADASTIDTRTAEQLRAQSAEQRRDLATRRIDLERQQESAQAELKAKREELEREFREREQALMAQIAPLKAELERLEELSWTVDLYLGRHEDVTLIQDGEPAPVDTPITIRQDVVAADEESLILGEEGTFDYEDMGTFVKWLTASPANRDRVLPDLRGVVVVIPTRQRRDYGNIFENAAKSAANTQAHWFIRNGDRIYLMVTDDEKLRVSDRILPKRDEFVEFFYARAPFGGERRPIEPGSAQWIEAEEKADKVKRHYMRLMLLLQGLVDRTVAFHPLPDGGVNLMSVASQDLGTVVLVNENDHVLTDGRPSFRRWQADLNKDLRVGVRVVLGNGIKEHYDSKYGENSRVSPPKASYPPTGVPLMVEGRDKDGALVVRYERTDKVWKKVWVETKPGWGYYTHDEVVPEKRASARIYPSDEWVLPFDLATVEDLNYYLGHRGARRDYQSMVPVIHSALRAKAAESEAEAPLRALLLSTIANEVTDTAEAEAELADLIAWWKTGNKWSRGPLAGDAETEAKAAVAIAAEWRKRQKAKPNPKAVAVVVAAAQRIEGALVAAYTRSKKFIVLAPAAPGEKRYVNEHTLDKSGKVLSTVEWTTPNSRVLSTMTTLWSAPEWASWDKYPDTSMALSGPELRTVLDTLAARLDAQGASTPITATSRHDNQTVTMFAWLNDADITDYGTYSDYARSNSWGRGAGPFMLAETVRWTRKGGEVAIRDYRGGESARFFHYEDRNEVGRPYRHGDKYRVTDYDEIKVWEDDAQMGRAMTVFAAHKARYKVDSDALREDNYRIRAVVNDYKKALHAAYVRGLEAVARAEFEVDFGTSAMDRPDLWKHHLATLKLENKVPAYPRNFDEALDRLVRAGVTLWGKSVTELVEIDGGLVTEQARYKVDATKLGVWADLTVSEPEVALSDAGEEAR